MADADEDRVHKPRPITAIAEVSRTTPTENKSRRIDDVNVCEYISASEFIYNCLRNLLSRSSLNPCPAIQQTSSLRSRRATAAG
jgi:hypothetical protein